MTDLEVRYTDIIAKVAKELELPFEVVDKTYRAFWRFVRTTIKELPFDKELTEEEFNQLQTSINIPSLGKFSCDYKRYLAVKERFAYIQKLKKK